VKKEFRYGKKVCETREARGWTQEHLAAVAGIDARTIQRVEKGLTKNKETLLAIAAAFGVDLESLQSTWLIAESRIVQAWLVTSREQLIGIEEAHRWEECRIVILAPLTQEGQREVRRLLDQVMADRDVTEPDEPELWESYLESVEEPLEQLFGLGLAMFLLDETKDLLLCPVGDLKPLSDHIPDWRVQYIFVVPRHGCFSLGPNEALHWFNPNCPAAVDSVWRAARPKGASGMRTFRNALWAVVQRRAEEGTNWCDSCFPVRARGSRITLEYLEEVTGLSRAQLYSIYESGAEEGFLGLA
jgi:transcriptional regulator with XRE-family HTH domain